MYSEIAERRFILTALRGPDHAEYQLEMKMLFTGPIRYFADSDYGMVHPPREAINWWNMLRESAQYDILNHVNAIKNSHFGDHVWCALDTLKDMPKPEKAPDSWILERTEYFNFLRSTFPKLNI